MHLVALIGTRNYGTNYFQFKFISLHNLQKLTRIQNIQNHITSRDIRLLIFGICNYTKLVSNRKTNPVQKFQLDKTQKQVYIESLNLVVTTLLKDIEQLERTGHLDLTEYTNILKTVSASMQYRRHIIFDVRWVDYLLDNIQRFNQKSINDIDMLLMNLGDLESLVELRRIVDERKGKLGMKQS